ncbi:MAG: SemiSWEET transporter [Nanoarchaeota archaeon]
MEIIGFVATGLTTGSLVPQVIKIYRTKDASSISLSMYVMYFVGILMWIAYGFHLDSTPIHISNFFGFIFSLSIIIMKIRYKNNKKL